jgi:hypothetical protein
VWNANVRQTNTDNVVSDIRTQQTPQDASEEEEQLVKITPKQDKLAETKRGVIWRMRQILMVLTTPTDGMT